ncbi:MAG: 3-hydroxybenzoate 6-hydroxylase 1 [Pseudomonadota bacterium]
MGLAGVDVHNRFMTNTKRTEVLIAGAGIGGLAAALAGARQGWAVTVAEQAAALSEVGAGVQLGPNATRRLHAWGLGEALGQVAFFPNRLQSLDAHSGRVLGSLPLGERATAQYGAPYATIHRADLHGLLHRAALAAGAQIRLGQAVTHWHEYAQGLDVGLANGERIEAEALVAADGVWSPLRQRLLADGSARFSGHLAYRALVPQADLPAHLRSDQVSVWMGPRLHVVQYPVQAGRSLNLVTIVQGERPEQANSWDHTGHGPALLSAMGAVAPALRERLEAVPEWRLWALHDRSPMSAASQMAQGRVALLGDAAHPMRPYLAQGAGMAIEDAQALAQCLSATGTSMAERLQRYAEQRWARNAQVQARAIRNGQIFHAQGAVALGRNWALRLMGERLMDQPWLYSA